MAVKPSLYEASDENHPQHQEFVDLAGKIVQSLVQLKSSTAGNVSPLDTSLSYKDRHNELFIFISTKYMDHFVEKEEADRRILLAQVTHVFNELTHQNVLEQDFFEKLEEETNAAAQQNQPTPDTGSTGQGQQDDTGQGSSAQEKPSITEALDPNHPEHEKLLGLPAGIVESLADIKSSLTGKPPLIFDTDRSYNDRHQELFNLISKIYLHNFAVKDQADQDFLLSQANGIFDELIKADVLEKDFQDRLQKERDAAQQQAQPTPGTGNTGQGQQDAGTAGAQQNGAGQSPPTPPAPEVEAAKYLKKGLKNFFIHQGIVSTVQKALSKASGSDADGLPDAFWDDATSNEQKHILLRNFIAQKFEGRIRSVSPKGAQINFEEESLNAAVQGIYDALDVHTLPDGVRELIEEKRTISVGEQPKWRAWLSNLNSPRLSNDPLEHGKAFYIMNAMFGELATQEQNKSKLALDALDADYQFSIADSKDPYIVIKNKNDEDSNNHIRLYKHAQSVRADFIGNRQDFSAADALVIARAYLEAEARMDKTISVKLSGNKEERALIKAAIESLQSEYPDLTLNWDKGNVEDGILAKARLAIQKESGSFVNDDFSHVRKDILLALKDEVSGQQREQLLKRLQEHVQKTPSDEFFKSVERDAAIIANILVSNEEMVALRDNWDSHNEEDRANALLKILQEAKKLTTNDRVRIDVLIDPDEQGSGLHIASDGVDAEIIGFGKDSFEGDFEEALNTAVHELMHATQMRRFESYKEMLANGDVPDLMSEEQIDEALAALNIAYEGVYAPPVGADEEYDEEADLRYENQMAEYEAFKIGNLTASTFEETLDAQRNPAPTPAEEPKPEGEATKQDTQNTAAAAGGDRTPASSSQTRALKRNIERSYKQAATPQDISPAERISYDFAAYAKALSIAIVRLNKEVLETSNSNELQSVKPSEVKAEYSSTKNEARDIVVEHYEGQEIDYLRELVKYGFEKAMDGTGQEFEDLSSRRVNQMKQELMNSGISDEMAKEQLIKLKNMPKPSAA